MSGWHKLENIIYIKSSTELSSLHLNNHVQNISLVKIYSLLAYYIWYAKVYFLSRLNRSPN